MSERNILILSMSILHGITESYYSTSDYKLFFRGISQLEAGTKYFIRTLQKDDRKLDKIYIIESSESRKSVDVNMSNQICSSGVLREEFMKDQKDDNNQLLISPVQFYEDRIWQYIQGEERQIDDFSKEKDDGLKIEREKMASEVKKYEDKLGQEERVGTIKSLKELYPQKEHLFQDIKMNDEKIVGRIEKDSDEPVNNSIHELCNKIQEEKKTGKGKDKVENVNLFIDMQGARRYETFIVNTAVKMLEMSDIYVESMVAIDFSSDTNKGKIKDGIIIIKPDFNFIVDTTYNNCILEMVSGMNEFIETGRGGTLKRFWNNLQKLKIQNTDTNKETPEEPIIKDIVRISDSITLCDVNQFDKCLDDLQDDLNTYNNSLDTEKDPLFASFVENLKQDYKGHHLFEKTPKTVDQISWCLDKGQYQQALTLLESKIPSDIVKDKILYYGDDKQLSYLVNYIAINIDNEIQDNIGIPDYEFDDKDGENYGYKHIKNEEISFVWIKYMLDRNAIEKSGQIKINIPHKLNSKGLQSQREKLKNELKVANMLDLYYKLAQKRNDLNHASPKDKSDIEVKKDNLKRDINKFIKMYKKCLRDKVEIDFLSVANDSLKQALEGEREREQNFEEIKKEIKRCENEYETYDSLNKFKNDDDSKWRDHLSNIWGEDSSKIDYYTKVKAAILEMKNLSLDDFTGNINDDETCITLKNLLDSLYNSEEHNNQTKEEFYTDSFTKKKKEPYIHLINSLKENAIERKKILLSDAKEGQQEGV